MRNKKPLELVTGGAGREKEKQRSNGRVCSWGGKKKRKNCLFTIVYARMNGYTPGKETRLPGITFVYVSRYQRQVKAGYLTTIPFEAFVSDV